MKLLKRIDNKGFTLVEMIAVIVIIGVISAPALYLYVDTQRQSIASRNKIDTQSKINASIKTIIEDLREAESDKFGTDNIPSIEVFDASYTVLGTNVKGVGIVARTTVKTTSTQKVVAYVLDTSDAKNSKITKYQCDNLNDIKRMDPAQGSTAYAISIKDYVKKDFITDNVKGFEIQKNSDGSYEVSITAQPNKVGSMVLNPITVTNRFIPRYLIN